jgi:hypothetical protein
MKTFTLSLTKTVIVSIEAETEDEAIEYALCNEADDRDFWSYAEPVVTVEDIED